MACINPVEAAADIVRSTEAGAAEQLGAAATAAPIGACRPLRIALLTIAAAGTVLAAAERAAAAGALVTATAEQTAA